MLTAVLFLLVAVVAVGSAIVAVAHSDPVVNVLSLVVTFFCVAFCYALMGAAFLAAAQILIYAGAILVLFLFVIMLLNAPASSRENEDRPAQRLFAVVGVAVLALSGLQLLFAPRGPAPAAGPGANVRELSLALVGPFGFTFELITVVLLAAMVGAMVLVRRKT